ncbi:MAG: MOSC domain-containing protein [Streptosporangiales bacterium]|nr:MOSC domain-containing protein [Streptosporangiales bacterium]
MTRPTLLSVNAGRAVDVAWAGGPQHTAIDKRPVPGRVVVGELGLADDEQADRKSHGGPDQALYAYAREDLDWWAARLGRELRNGQFGENLTVRGIDVGDAAIGERWRVGTVLLEVSGPRIPCKTFQGWLGERGWIKRFTAEARSGAYLRVLEEGEVGAGDRLEIAHRPPHGFTVRDAFLVRNGRRELLPRVLEVPELPPGWHDWAARLLAAR